MNNVSINVIIKRFEIDSADAICQGNLPYQTPKEFKGLANQGYSPNETLSPLMILAKLVSDESSLFIFSNKCIHPGVFHFNGFLHTSYPLSA
jgi:hypothetical protein